MVPRPVQAVVRWATGALSNGGCAAAMVAGAVWHLARAVVGMPTEAVFVASEWMAASRELERVGLAVLAPTDNGPLEQV